jgi:hypothetical protein
MSELDSLLERLKRTAAGPEGFADWRTSEEALGNRVADSCTLTADTANALCDDILTVIQYFVNHLPEFNVTIMDLIRETIRIAKTRKLNHSAVEVLMTALEHFSTAHQIRHGPENVAEWERVNRTMRSLTRTTRDLLLMPK